MAEAAGRINIARQHCAEYKPKFLFFISTLRKADRGRWEQEKSVTTERVRWIKGIYWCQKQFSPCSYRLESEQVGTTGKKNNKTKLFFIVEGGRGGGVSGKSGSSSANNHDHCDHQLSRSTRFFFLCLMTDRKHETKKIRFSGRERTKNTAASRRISHQDDIHMGPSHRSCHFPHSHEYYSSCSSRRVCATDTNRWKIKTKEAEQK